MKLLLCSVGVSLLALSVATATRAPEDPRLLQLQGLRVSSQALDYRAPRHRRYDLCHRAA
jgi:hypothetical protein